MTRWLNSSVWSPSSGGWRPEVKVLAEEGALRVGREQFVNGHLLSVFHNVCLLQCLSLCPNFPLSWRRWVYRTRAHPSYLILSNYICTDPVSKYGHILRRVCWKKNTTCGVRVSCRSVSVLRTSSLGDGTLRWFWGIVLKRQGWGGGSQGA